MAQLIVWGPSWGVASVDPESLSVLAYLRFSGRGGVGVTVSDSSTRRDVFFKHGADVQLPMLIPEGKASDGEDGPDPVVSGPAVVSWLRGDGKGHNLDIDLSYVEAAESLALEALVEESLRPAIQRYIWLDDAHVGKISVKAGFDTTPFPFSYITPRYTRARAEASRNGQSDEQLLTQAGRCFTALSNRLGGNDFFFNDKPTYVDAVVFGYVAIILHADTSEPDLLNLLNKSAPNLVRWVERLEKKYFANEIKRQAKISSEQGMKVWLSAQSVQNITAVSVALAAMSLYGLTLVSQLLRRR